MKKELFAAGLLALLLLLSILNTAAIKGLCSDIDSVIRRAGAAAEAGDWESARERMDSAVSLWRSHETYAKIVMRHTDIETLTDDFFELMEHINTEDPGAVRSAVELVTEHLGGIAEMESLSLGSIF